MKQRITSPHIIKLIFLSLFIWNISFSQTTSKTYSGVILDAHTKKPLKYAHIGVLNKNLGAISTNEGKFQINLSKASPDDILAFSMLGYVTKKLAIKDLKENSFIITLVTKVYVLEEVLLTTKTEKVKLKRFGRFKPSKRTTGQSGKEEFGVGKEWGIRINNHQNSYYIKDINFHLRFNSLDSILFRVNIYKVDSDGKPGETILNKNLFVKSYKKKKWVRKAIESESIFINYDVIVTFEIIRRWFNKSSDNALFITHGQGYEEGQAYSRDSSFDVWKVNQSPPVTLYFTGILDDD